MNSLCLFIQKHYFGNEETPKDFEERVETIISNKLEENEKIIVKAVANGKSYSEIARSYIIMSKNKVRNIFLITMGRKICTPQNLLYLKGLTNNIADKVDKSRDISYLNIDIRTYNALVRGANKIGLSCPPIISEIASKTKEELLSLKGFGEESYCNLISALIEQELALPKE